MKKYKAYERDPQFEYALYSEDDDVCIYENENDAIVTKKAWIKSGANGVKGPFALHRSALDKAAPELLAVCKNAMHEVTRYIEETKEGLPFSIVLAEGMVKELKAVISKAKGGK